jgi:phosphomannomutase
MPRNKLPQRARRHLDQIDATAPYIARYVTAFGTESLNGLTIGVYEHSSVARDIMSDVLTTLGATVVRFGRSEVFIPVDTEAVDPDTRSMLQTLCRDHGLDAIVSTDGDADRPMVTDASGQVIVGDVLGVMTALLLAADTICTPGIIKRHGAPHARVWIGPPDTDRIALCDCRNGRGTKEPSQSRGRI